MVGVLDQLEAKSLIKRRRGADRRTNGVWLTRTGRGVLSRAKRAIAAHEKRVAARLSPAERAQLLKLLARIAV
jgi:DNA-binding MarR family transcriptional regulator